MDVRSVHVIVRGVGERTESHARQLLATVFGAERVEVIRERPFSRAIVVGLERGLERGAEWILCIDADVLVSARGVQQLLDRASSLPGEGLAIQGLIWDKFFPVLRPAGNHLYRSKWAREAIACIPVEGSSLRPESDMLRAMQAKGHPWAQCDAVVGVHDFEQFHSDVFRKCFLQAHKHRHVMQRATEYWESLRAVDSDFEVALLAARHGAEYDGVVTIDKEFLHARVAAWLAEAGIREKSPLATDFALGVDELIEARRATLDESWQEFMYSRAKWNRLSGKQSRERKSRWGRMGRALRRLLG